MGAFAQTSKLLNTSRFLPFFREVGGDGGACPTPKSCKTRIFIVFLGRWEVMDSLRNP